MNSANSMPDTGCLCGYRWLVAYWGLLRGSESGRRENGIVARGSCQLCGIRQFFERQILLRIKDKKLLFVGRNMAKAVLYVKWQE